MGTILWWQVQWVTSYDCLSSTRILFWRVYRSNWSRRYIHIIIMRLMQLYICRQFLHSFSILFPLGSYAYVNGTCSGHEFSLIECANDTYNPFASTKCNTSVYLECYSKLILLHANITLDSYHSMSETGWDGIGGE